MKNIDSVRTLKLELETAEYKKILIGFVESEDAAHELIDNFADLYHKLIDENISTISDGKATIEELTSCPILQEWEGSQAIVGTWYSYGKITKEEVIF